MLSQVDKKNRFRYPETILTRGKTTQDIEKQQELLNILDGL
jgi:hypothetical protein